MPRLLRRRLSPSKPDSNNKTTKQKSSKASPLVSKKSSPVPSKRETKSRTTKDSKSAPKQGENVGLQTNQPRITKARVAKKVPEQDENKVSQSKNPRVAKKADDNNDISSLNSPPLKHDAKNKKPEPLAKSPVLRDRKNELGKRRKILRKYDQDVLDDSSFNLPASAENMTLKEKKTLRPREHLRDYYEESKLSLSPRIRESRVTLVKLPDDCVKKVPIWKTIQFSDAKKDGKDIYDISDSDLSFEEDGKKRKKQPIKKPVKRLKKTVKFAKTVKKKPTQLIAKQENVAPKSVPVIPKSSQVHADPKSLPQVQINSKSSQVQINSKSPPQVQPASKPDSKVSLSPKPDAQVQLDSSSPLQILKKPRMFSVEILDKKTKLSFALSPKEFRPFRVTQNFRPRSTMMHTMLDHSLLSKTLSPIVSTTEKVDISSPWRIPQPENFSRVRNMFQSTPQAKTSTGLLSRRNTAPSKRTINIIEESMQEISKEPEDVESKNYEIPHVASPMEAFVQNLFPEEFEDKENETPNSQSPQKGKETPVFEPQPGPSGLQKQPLRELRVLRQTNLNDFLNLDDTPERTEILTPHGIFDDVQSTPVNGKFLKKNVQQDIQNAFGFDDGSELEESPIVPRKEKPVPKGILRERRENGQVRRKSKHRNSLRFSPREILKTLQKRRVEREIESNENSKSQDGENDQQEAVEKVKKQMKQTLKKDNSLEKRTQIDENESAKESGEEDQKQEKETEEKSQKQPKETEESQKQAKETEEESQEEVSETEEKSQEQETSTINFADTFDLLEEGAEENKNNSSVLPLFVDIEPPTHFVKPAKSIYKRKRDWKFSFDEENENDENKNGLKDKKKSKKCKKEDKKLNEWAKNINKCFDEIDHFDLIVE